MNTTVRQRNVKIARHRLIGFRPLVIVFVLLAAGGLVFGEDGTDQRNLFPSNSDQTSALKGGSLPASQAFVTPPTLTTQSGLDAALPKRKFSTDPPAIPVSPITAAPSGVNYLPEDTIVLMAGNSRIFDFRQRIRRISVADTEVADLQVVNPYQINLIGHKVGFTTVAIWDNQGHYEERQVRVDPFGKQQVLLNVIVAELDRTRMETQAINWSAALSNYNISLLGIGPGGAATPYTPQTDLTPSTVFGLGSSNQASVANGVTGTVPAAGQIIPLLLSSALNYGLTWGNSNVQTQAFFNFLETHNLAKVLAEPHLLANSGEKAEFLSGGEIPIVVSQALNTSIVFKQFGTSVVFVPTVVGKDMIEMDVRPEVSEPDYTHGVSMFGFTVPAFVTRRAQTVVRLKNSQTLIIAGLILRNRTSQVQKTPYLGDLPYVGSLFKHTSYDDQNTDLVMSVTPQIVQPIPVDGRAATPIERPPLSAGDIRTERLSQPDESRPRF